MTTVPAGKLFCFTEGEYSDYGIKGTFLALEEINQELFERIRKELMARWLIDPPTVHGWSADLNDESDVTRLLSDEFLPALIRAGVVMDIDVVHIHYGSYGRIELFDK